VKTTSEPARDKACADAAVERGDCAREHSAYCIAASSDYLCQSNVHVGAPKVSTSLPKISAAMDTRTTSAGNMPAASATSDTAHASCETAVNRTMYGCWQLAILTGADQGTRRI
jgi:hypothetical protein